MTDFNMNRPAGRRAARLDEFRKALPEVVAHSPQSGGSAKERERIAKSLTRSTMPVKALEGLGRIHTGDRSIGKQGRWGRIERDVGPASGKPGVQMSRGFHEYGARPDQLYPNMYLRADRQLTLIHEIGHHAEHTARQLSLSQFAGAEGRAENFAYRHAGGNKGQEGFSEYDATINEPRTELKRRWGANKVKEYKAERGAGRLPGEPTAPASSWRQFVPHDFTAAKAERSAQAEPQPEREAG